ncbi:MAG: amidohydrolase [Bacteroidetes bacterium]|nr:amidohydrolase [Bacteroidota bacterium]
MELQEKIRALAKESSAEIINCRNYLHAHPELSFEENNTAKFVCSTLDEFGITYGSGIVGTGIIGVLEGVDPGSKIIALRAELDALPIQEGNDVEYKSTNEGVMHACGHDVHMASLMGVLNILNQLKAEWSGSVKFIFEPGEEKLPGGASLLIKEGVLDNPAPEMIMSQHVMPELVAGKVGFRSGKYMASADEIYVEVKGKGGHAALPANNIDPIMIATKILLALKDEDAPFNDDSIPSILAFGSVHADGATNVIPDNVKMEGTFRTMNEEWRAEAHEKMKQIATEIAHANGGECDFNIIKGYPFLSNDEAATDASRSFAQEYLGKENVVELDIRMTSDDFAFFSKQIPGCYYRLGVGNILDGIISSVHSPTFNIDESALETGTGLLAWLTVKNLGN